MSAHLLGPRLPGAGRGGQAAATRTHPGAPPPHHLPTAVTQAGRPVFDASPLAPGCVCVRVLVGACVRMHRWVFNVYYSPFSLEFSSPWGWDDFTFNKHCFTQCLGLFVQRKVGPREEENFRVNSVKWLFAPAKDDQILALSWG